MTLAASNSNSNSEAFILCPLLVDQGCITKQTRVWADAQRGRPRNIGGALC